MNFFFKSEFNKNNEIFFFKSKFNKNNEIFFPLLFDVYLRNTTLCEEENKNLNNMFLIITTNNRDRKN